MLKSKITYKLVVMGILIAPAFALAAAAPLAKTGQTTIYVAGDDGHLQTGQAWPTPRFSNNGNSTVTDNLTGIIWTESANAPGPAACGPATTKSWQGALDYVKCLNNNSYLGYNDWFLPNRKEMLSLLNIEQANPGNWLTSQGFTNVQTAFGSYYWTSTTYAAAPVNAFSVNMYWGDAPGAKNKGNSYRVWPARFVNPSAKVAQTGQTTCWDTAGAVVSCAGTKQDGELRTGVAWPVPRFTDNTNGTTTDNLTGLIWTTSANAPGPETCGTAVAKTWQGALDHVACLNSNNYLGYSDWRLPNRKELLSLLNIEQTNPGNWLTSKGFTDVQAAFGSYYWTSTTYAAAPVNAFSVNMYWGDAPGAKNKGNSYRVWPVR